MKGAHKRAPVSPAANMRARGAAVLFSHRITIIIIVVQMQSDASAPVRLPPRASARAGPQAPFCLLFPILSEQLSQSFRTARVSNNTHRFGSRECSDAVASHWLVAPPHEGVVTQRQRSLHK